MQKKTFKRGSEKIIRWILGMSAAFTSLTVVLIIIFLFREGISVFSEKPIEKGFELAVNKSNTVKTIRPELIKKIFDGEITNWKALGGNDQEIKLFTINDLDQYFTEEELGENFVNLPDKISELVAKEPGILADIPNKYLTKAFDGKLLEIKKITVWDFLAGREWFPTSRPVALFGIWPMILGTLLVTLGAIILALPFAMATAIYMAEVADSRIRSFLKPIIELLAGIPSVVYGFFGLVIIVPLVQKTFNLPVGETGLSGSIVLAIMILPTIITISEDALRNCPNSLRQASLALGATRWQTIKRVVLPYSISGVTTAVILGIGRAFGETMAVLMVTGNAAVIPHTILEPMRTITATIAAELGEASQGGLHFKALFALGCILFIITFLTNIVVQWVSNRQKLSR
jgi:phosphate transport system permease protein